jgi:hypothetical protein
VLNPDEVGIYRLTSLSLIKRNDLIIFKESNLLKKLFSIFLLSIFLFAQFGKVISYMYCKWEYRSEVKCDCEKIFVQDEHQKVDQMTNLNSIPKWDEPLALQQAEVPLANNKSLSIYHSYYPLGLFKGFPGLPFHPPAVV